MEKNMVLATLKAAGLDISEKMAANIPDDIFNLDNFLIAGPIRY